MDFPKFYKPKKSYKLYRFGKNNDGGYLIGSKSVNKSKFLISYGISDDWSFEFDILKKNQNLKVFSFDDSLSFKFLLKLILLNFLRIFYFKSNLRIFFHSIYKFFNFILIKKRINFKKKTIKYNDTIKISKKLNDIIFKIDIEGSEYRILDDLIKIKKKINSVIIEFHDIDLHHKKIQNFISAMGLKLTHIHPNNYSLPDKYGNPTAVEITLERYTDELNGKVKLPNRLDMKCNPYNIDYTLKFKN
jgi:hypothetical protein